MAQNASKTYTEFHHKEVQEFTEIEVNMKDNKMQGLSDYQSAFKDYLANLSEQVGPDAELE